VDALAVVSKLSRIFGSSDWEAMRALYHPEALLQTVTRGSEPVTPDELIAGLERASRDTWFSVQSWKNIAIDDHAVIIVGRMRRSMPSGGFEDVSHVWLLTVRDGLIYRQGVFSTADAAADTYRHFGMSLGVADVTVPGVQEEHGAPAAVKRLKPVTGES
jgi:hypothetical protein